MKLGKKPPRIDPRTLQLAKYFLPSALPPLPPVIDWTHAKENFGMMLNDSLGDCTIAACAHSVQIWTINRGVERTPADAEVLALYEAWDGYNPQDPSTDQGGVILDVLNRWRKSSFAGALLAAYAQVDQNDIEMVSQAIHLFGAVDIGLQLPQSALDQFNAGEPWTISRNSPTAGGHSVALCGYNPIGPLCVTWGKPQQMTWTFFFNFCDEAYALQSPLWLDKEGESVSGIDLAAIQRDLAAIST